MKSLLSVMDKKNLQLVKKVSALASQEGVSLFIVGGVVRDLFLHRKNVDLDFVLEADATEFAKKFAKKFSGRVIVHERFKTATVVLNGRRVDVASARKEIYPFPGALPVVELGKIKDDLFRRDFTINAMAWGLNKNNYGQLIDPFSGQVDLKQKKIRILHPKSFQDDPTRILRAIRFEQRFKFHLEAQTLRLLKEAIQKNYPLSVTPQRYFLEFVKMFKEDNPELSLKRLFALGGMKFFGHDLTVQWGNFTLLKKRIPLLKKHFLYKNFDQWWFLYFFALLEKAPSSQLDHLFALFPIPKEAQKSILEIRNKSDIIKLSQKHLKSSQLCRVVRPLRAETLLYWQATSGNRIALKRINEYLRVYSKITLKINGHDILALGLLREEKFVKEVLGLLLDAKIDGYLKTRRDEIKLAKEIIAKKKFYGKT